jgi:hypothetical protein
VILQTVFRGGQRAAGYLGVLLFSEAITPWLMLVTYPPEITLGKIRKNRKYLRAAAHSKVRCSDFYDWNSVNPVYFMSLPY